MCSLCFLAFRFESYVVFLREIEIMLERTTYSPGEQIEGYVYVTTDDDFEYNAITLTMRGYEKTTVTRGSGKNRRVYRDKHDYINETVLLAEPGTLYPGDHRFDFALILPKEIPGSYYGIAGKIIYQIEAKIEVSWAIDPKTKQELFVAQTIEQISPQRKIGYIEHEGQSLLEIELERDTVEIGRDFTVRVRLNPVREFRCIRMELFHEEEVIADGYHDTAKRRISGWELPDEKLPPGVWVDVGMSTSTEFPLTFRTHLIDSRYVLKFTIDIPWRLDKKLETPIAVTILNPAESSDPWFQY